ncbi:hypothetical protein [Zestomonas carbonaria]|uniref:Uncharacterized protein n=1 Tax=Zestomonas carbonaria TaxID=2762745 RepID=A0A7U7EN87_9GAMM|nr:hypothetical protein [Pseudomonas carbonaria]CAD5108128.1 hypothetical protein PSEWESI4_02412 [Pseudomonas carbonaria]
MDQVGRPLRVICNDSGLASALEPVLSTLAPGCELLRDPCDCSALPFCRWFAARLGQAGQVQVALAEATEVLERTRHAFKSRELGLLRRRLQALLEELASQSQ